MATHEFEPELKGDTPRPVRWRTFGHAFGIWSVRLFILPHTLVGFGVFVAAVWASACWPVVLLFGTVVDGRVEGTTATRNQKTGSTYYSASYSFNVGNDVYRRQTTLSADGYASLQKGSVVPVRVCTWLPSYGDWPDVPGHTALGFPGLWCVALFWNGILSVFLWQLYVVPWRQWDLVRRGVPVVGRVTAVGPSGDKQRPHRVRYEFRRPADGGWTGAGSVSVSAIHGVQIGDAVTVLVDPRRPTRSVAYALADFRAC